MKFHLKKCFHGSCVFILILVYWADLGLQLLENDWVKILQGLKALFDSIIAKLILMILCWFCDFYKHQIH